jgi:aminomethyltransferase
LSTTGEPRRTPLYAEHVALGGRIIDFSGWELPVQYAGIVEEHRAVRASAGLFDLSHMGEVRVRGGEAAAALASALASDPRRLAVGRAHYSFLCTPEGGVIDDLIVYRIAADELLVVPNAGGREVVVTELTERTRGRDAALADESMGTSLLAVQGPAAAGIVARLTSVALKELRPYGCVHATVANVEVLLARTGYTGEDGFELFMAWPDGPAVWDALLEAGQRDGLVPVGLGARDTLRLEAGMPLYGHELDRTTDPFEAGLGRFVHLDRQPGQHGEGSDFVGGAALRAASERPLTRQLIGLLLQGRGIARAGHALRRPGDGHDIGRVTSGSQSPTLDAAIAMAYVPPPDATPGTMLEVVIREAVVPAEVVPLPFYRRPR